MGSSFIPPVTVALLLQTREPAAQSFRSDGVPYSERSSAVQASPARAYLRHIASAPNIPRRRLPGQHAPPPVLKKSTISLKDNLNAQAPRPLPPSWLEAVARTILGFGARTQRSDTMDSPRQPRIEPLRNSTSRSSTIRGYGRSTRSCRAATSGDTAGRQRGRSILTNQAVSQPPTMQATRSQASLGEVIKMNVVCRSAPASRSSSVVGRKPRNESPATASLGNLSGGSVRGKGKAPKSSSRNFRPK